LEVTELRVAITVADFDGALAFYRDALGLSQIASAVTTPWGDRNRRVRAPDGMQLTLFTTPS
jgi:catechol 2,3-dioxygenase-like lactoylglutathione lyase family enzyme